MNVCVRNIITNIIICEQNILYCSLGILETSYANDVTTMSITLPQYALITGLLFHTFLMKI